MDNYNDPNIIFDEQGISNYYYEYNSKNERFKYGPIEQQILIDQFISSIKAVSKKNAANDCILGVSGGVDSTYLALLSKRLGLNPLLVHVDNGWNSPIAVRNIENVANKLNLDLFTYVIDWHEFRDLQLSYLKASVVDIEVLTDHAISAVLLKTAQKANISYILSGINFQTETTMPKTWNYAKNDHLNILSIHNKYGQKKLKTYPILSPRQRNIIERLNNIKTVSLLNYINYNYSEVKKELMTELDWMDYGVKHGESTWTKFYQNYLLPHKFKIDKRIPHYSDLIFSGQISKDTALKYMKIPLYDLCQQIEIDYALKKLGLSNIEFTTILNQPIRSHYEYDHIMPIDKRYPLLRPIKYLYRSLFK